jgi:antitoxin CptB
MKEAHRESDPQARALIWRCRRGMKELDVLLERYARAALPQASAAERGLLARLLERPDPELAGYFLAGEVPVEPEMAALVRRIAGTGLPWAFEARRDETPGFGRSGEPLGTPRKSAHHRA